MTWGPLDHWNRRSIAMRLFATCWIIYIIHFSSNIVREIYPALALGDHLSFRVDEYAHMHPDLFEKEGYGWHIGNNPGISMLAAVPYAALRPVIDPIVERVRQQRTAQGATEPPAYNSPWQMARDFYAESWRRGLDIKFGLAAFVMHALCMAPSSALSVVLMFYVMQYLLNSNRLGLLLALLYAFGTPVFFRTGFLNHNLMLGHIVFAGFIAVWNPWGHSWPAAPARCFLAGIAGGTALLFDYSGAVMLLCLFGYVVARQMQRGNWSSVFASGSLYVLGTLPPVFLLWFYQWQSFGHPFFPGQHWMPPVQWIERGYQGYGAPQLELLWMLACDYRFGLFVVCPLFGFALLYPFMPRRSRRLPRLELLTMLGFFFAMWVFFSGSNYTRLQFNTGIRYMAPIFPFLFIPAALAMVRFPRPALLFIVLFSIVESWCMAMHRDVEVGPGILNPILHVFCGGFELPLLTRMSQMSVFQAWFDGSPSPLPIFAVAAAVIAGLWMIHARPTSPADPHPPAASATP